MMVIVALLGMIPVARAFGIRSDVQRPLATVVVGGLSSTLVLTLLAFPSLCYMVENARTGKRKSATRRPQPNQKLFSRFLMPTINGKTLHRIRRSCGTWNGAALQGQRCFTALWVMGCTGVFTGRDYSVL